MKHLFIPARIKSSINKNSIIELSKKLPKNIALAYSIQYEELAKEIKQIFSKNHNITFFSQVLGCSKPNFSKQTQAIILVSSGKFHAVSLALESNLPVYILYNNSIQKISDKEIDALRKRKKTAYLKFLSSDKVGILVATKPGQENLKRALELKKSLKLKNKKSYILIGNNLSPNEFENFHIDSWVNTACPRLDMDFPVINLDKLNRNNL